MKEAHAEGGYEDFLSHMTQLGGELTWITQRRNFPRTKVQGAFLRHRNPSDIIKDVLNSSKLKVEEIEFQAKSRGLPKNFVENEAKEILSTMAHQMNMFSIRGVGYAVVKMLFDAIFVNVNHLSKIKNAFEDNPVIFIPTHRSYLDFLLLSVICFDQEIPLPAIASAVDFLNSRVIGETLRRCGAFFIKRRIGRDRLYWLIFSEYVQSHVINGDHPLEFFIDGTRSRSNKSLYPKFGLLQALLEPYFRRQVYDMVIIPITISYDKIIEESLFAYELLGFGKPKETASGLFKARKILNGKYGRVFMTFGNPISLKYYFPTLRSLLYFSAV
uniref:PlsC domain-containing protein n=1 Tax=Syphacia muris TaxID=451379 RepID=A0A0N5AU74_9BILA